MQNLTNGFVFFIGASLGTLMTTDVSGSGITQPDCEWSRTRTVVIFDKSLFLRCCSQDSSFAHFPLLSLVIDHSFLFRLSFILFQMRFGSFLIPTPTFLEGFFLLASHRSLKIIQVILTQYVCLFGQFETSNLCTCVRTGNAWCVISTFTSSSISTCT